MRKSFRLTISELPGWWGGLALTVLSGVSGACDYAHGQSAPAASPPPRAFVRIWDFLPDKAQNNLMVLAGDKTPLIIVAPNNFATNYYPAPTGSYSLTVRRLSDTSGGAIQRVPVALAPNAFITLLVSDKNAQSPVTVVNDTPDPRADPALAKITLRQMFPGAQVTVKAAGGTASQPLNAGDTAVLDNIPAKAQVTIHLHAVLPTTPPTTRDWDTTGDFSVDHQATLLIVPDTYGRLRPILAMDALIPANIDKVPPH